MFVINNNQNMIGKIVVEVSGMRKKNATMGRRDVEKERDEGKIRRRLHLPLNRRLTIKEEATVVSSERDRHGNSLDK